MTVTAPTEVDAATAREDLRWLAHFNQPQADRILTYVERLETTLKLAREVITTETDYRRVKNMGHPKHPARTTAQALAEASFRRQAARQAWWALVGRPDLASAAAIHEEGRRALSTSDDTELTGLCTCDGPWPCSAAGGGQ